MCNVFFSHLFSSTNAWQLRSYWSAGLYFIVNLKYYQPTAYRSVWFKKKWNKNAFCWQIKFYFQNCFQTDASFSVQTLPKNRMQKQLIQSYHCYVKRQLSMTYRFHCYWDTIWLYVPVVLVARNKTFITHFFFCDCENSKLIFFWPFEEQKKHFTMGNKSSLLLRQEEIAQIQENTGC